MQRIDDESELAWLEARDPGHLGTGYDVVGFEASAWILHAMYETDRLPANLSQEEVRRIEEAAGIRTVDSGDERLDAALNDPA